MGDEVKNIKKYILATGMLCAGLILSIIVLLNGMDVGIPKSKTMEMSESVVKQPEARYFFHQQVNDMCMIAPMLNLKLLELMKNEDGTYELSKVADYSRREWMALNIPYLLRWHGIIENLNHPLGKNQYSHLVSFIENAKKYGPVFPHFYDEMGNSLLSTNMRD